MIRSRTAADRLRQAFSPTPLGVVGLTDQLLGACVGGDVVFERVGDHCAYRWMDDGDTQEGVVPIRPAAFRTILARVAALCNERLPNSVTPYGGEGLLSAPGHPSELLRVRFVNTPEQQQLTLTSARPTGAVVKEPPQVSASPAENSPRSPGGLAPRAVPG